MARERTRSRRFTDRYLLSEDGTLGAPLTTLALDPGRPLELDLGCGRGRFLIARAAAHPDHAFIGVDRMSVRLRKLDRRLVKRGLTNVRLIRAETLPVLQRILPSACATTCYVFFPDPWPKRRHRRRRLFQPPLREALSRVLRDGGVVHVATDQEDYAAEVQRLFREDARFEPAPPFEPADEEQTDFEVIFRRQNRPVHRLAFRKPSATAVEAVQSDR
jgi:tRNA (guanine-N7-)-methyltransferase